jgi:hypothetical protein
MAPSREHMLPQRVINGPCIFHIISTTLTLVYQVIFGEDAFPDELPDKECKL